MQRSPGTSTKIQHKEESLWTYKVTREPDINSNINAGDRGKDESKGLSITDKNCHRQSGPFKWLVVTRLWFVETQRAQKTGHLAHTIAGCLLTHYNPSADSFAWHLSAVHLAALPPHLQRQLRVCLLQFLNNKANITILIFGSNLKYLLLDPIAQFADKSPFH